MSADFEPFFWCPQFMDDSDLEIEALNCLFDYEATTGFSAYKGCQVKAEQVCETQLLKHDYSYHLDEELVMQKGENCWQSTEGYNVLGYTSFKKKEVHVKNKMLTKNTTIAHETKHAIHDSQFFQFFPPAYLAKEHVKLETQAKTFARLLTLPKDVFEQRFRYLDHRVADFNKTLSHLMFDFQVSGRTILLRAFELGLISEKRMNFFWHKKNYMLPHCSSLI